MCNREKEEPEASRGKLIECPHCSCYVAVPSEHMPAQKAEASVQPPKEDDVSDERLEQLERGEGETAEPELESVAERKLPWFIDILLYPISKGGLSTIAIILLLKLLTDIAAGLLTCCVCVGGILSLIIRIIIVYSYMYWYFSECVRDSATGGLRAPEALGSMPGLGAMIWQFLRLFACYAFSLGPVSFYLGYVFLHEIERNSFIFWALLSYGIFFFPMGILAVVMFDSVNGLKPTLLIRSIASTFFHYCGLVILFYGLGILFGVLLAMMRSISARSGFFSSLFLAYISSNIFFIYALLIVAHLLGRFYWRYERKLYWEV